MDMLLQSPYSYIIGIAVCLIVFRLCARFGTTVQKITSYVLAITLLAVLAYTAAALLNLLLQQK